MSERLSFRGYHGIQTVEYTANGDDTYELFVDGEKVGTALTYREMVAAVKSL